MSYIRTDDGVRLYIEEVGDGDALLFLHEFAADHSSWKPQVGYFSRKFRCITYSARGYSPSDVPPDPNSYSQDRAVDDAVTVVRKLGLSRVSLIGLSMGAATALWLSLREGDLVACQVLASIGYGSSPGTRDQFRKECTELAHCFESLPMAEVADRFAHGPARLPLLRKDPKSWQAFRDMMARRSPVGAAFTIRRIQMERPSFYDSVDLLERSPVPTLVLAGDDDWGSLEPALFLKSHIPRSGLAVCPQAGHTLNLEEPDWFNHTVAAFLTAADHGEWEATRQGPNLMWP